MSLKKKMNRTNDSYRNQLENDEIHITSRWSGSLLARFARCEGSAQLIVIEVVRIMQISQARAKLQQLLFIILFMLTGLLTGCSGSARYEMRSTADPTDMTTDFFEGQVQIVDFNYQVTRFQLAENKALVDVRNDIHIRLVDDPYNLPKTFPIIAPMTAVSIVDGEVPPSYISKYTLKYYLSLKAQYEKYAPQSTSSPTSEKIINKQDADYIFSLNRAGWEAYVKRMIHPDGWKVQLSPYDTGTGVMSFDPNSGFGLSIQPLYNGNEGPPTILIVGSYYPLETLPDFTAEFKKSLENDVLKDLGPNYSVSATYTKMPPFEAIELTVMRK